MGELRNLVAKPENNGRQAHIKSFIDDIQKYEVMLMSRKTVKVKRENLASEPKKASGREVEVAVMVVMPDSMWSLRSSETKSTSAHNIGETTCSIFSSPEWFRYW